jgi:hypothetical protein
MPPLTLYYVVLPLESLIMLAESWLSRLILVISSCSISESQLIRELLNRTAEALVGAITMPPAATDKYVKSGHKFPPGGPEWGLRDTLMSGAPEIESSQAAAQISIFMHSSECTCAALHPID